MQPVRVWIMNGNRVTYFGFSCAVLLHCSAAKGWGYGEYRERSYRVLSGTTDTERRFEQMIEQRDIKLAINTLLGEGLMSQEIQDAVQESDFSAFLVGIGRGISVLLQGR